MELSIAENSVSRWCSLVGLGFSESTNAGCRSSLLILLEELMDLLLFLCTECLRLTRAAVGSPEVTVISSPLGD